jgi:thiamine biosynthesis lipoprotein
MATRLEFTEPHMGMQARIVLFAEDSQAATRAAAAAFARIADLDRTLSDYRADSELMELCEHSGGGPVRVSDDLLAVLMRSLEISAASDGAFDVTVGPVTKLWREAKRRGTPPGESELTAVHSLVNWRNVKLDERNRTVELLQPGMRLDLGGIAKGYAADCAVQILNAHGFACCLVGLAGDLKIGDAPPGKQGWSIALETGEPNDSPIMLDLHNVAISTSGDAEQFLVIDGQRHSHIINPARPDDLGLTDRIAVTVIARDGMTADALATAVSVMGPQRGLKLIESIPGAGAAGRVIVITSGGESAVYANHEFPVAVAP